jgi:hypothetical protein
LSFRFHLLVGTLDIFLVLFGFECLSFQALIEENKFSCLCVHIREDVTETSAVENFSVLLLQVSWESVWSADGFKAGKGQKKSSQGLKSDFAS